MKVLLFIFAVIFALTNAQIHKTEIKPKSQFLSLKTNHKINLPKVVLAKALEAEKEDVGKDVAPRYGVPHFVNHNLHNAGTFTTQKDGSRIWRLTYRSADAHFLVIAFDRFKLAKGATLHVLPKNHKHMGAYTSENNKKDNTFAVGPIRGDEFTLELFEPSNVVGYSTVRVKSVTHAYKDLFGWSKTKNGRSGSCNINVACPQGEGWEGQTQSVALLMRSTGFRFCTGSLINNAKNDGKQYFLTAAHCGADLSTAIAVFNYQQSECQRGTRSTDATLSGFNRVAYNRVSDFHLVELRETIPENYNLYFGGFSKSDEAEQNKSAGIHHPSGDAKKIALCDTPLTHSRWGSGPQNTHWRVNRWSDGTTEPGSSGSPLYDSKKRVIGQLHGGTASCRNPSGWDVYGKIATSWEGANAGARLKDHLDPDNTVVDGIDGIWHKDVKAILK